MPGKLALVGALLLRKRGASMPSLGHPDPNGFAFRLACEFRHELAFSRMLHEVFRRRHPLTPVRAAQAGYPTFLVNPGTRLQFRFRNVLHRRFPLRHSAVPAILFRLLANA